MTRPKSITKAEFCAKLEHLKKVLKPHNFRSIYIHSEGALRWLTGMRHQVVDLDPYAPTTVQALVEIEPELSIKFFSDPWEAARIEGFMKRGIWQDCEIPVSYTSTPPNLRSPKILSPTNTNYSEIEREIVSPLAEGLIGNQWKKLTWLINESRQALLEIASHITVGMNGWQLRSLVFEAYHRRHLELNLVLLGLSGMKTYLHPVIEDDSYVEEGSIVKLVIGARYFDMFHSASQLVKIGQEPSERELLVHEALQAAALDYTALFSPETTEAELYEALSPIFHRVERTYELPGFAASAYLHHPGGPVSPLGNRDFVITQDGLRKIYPYTQFSVNPVDALEYLKFELQGVALPDATPLICNDFAWCTDQRFFVTRKFNQDLVQLPTIIPNGVTLDA